MKPVPTVFVVDGDASARESLKLLVQSVGFGVETFESTQDFLAAFSSERPGCIVADVPGRGGLELQDRLATQGSFTPIIFLATRSDIATAVLAMKRGAIDFIEKPATPERLLQRIREAVNRDACLRTERLRVAQIRQRMNLLTPREREVLELVIAGRANKEVAAKLHVSARTVEVHRAHVMKKLQAGTVAELVRMAMIAEIEAPGEGTSI